MIRTRKFLWVRAVFFLGVVFTGLQWSHFYKEVNVRKIVVYNINGHTAVDLFDRGKVCFLGDSALEGNLQKVNFHIVSNRIRSGALMVDSLRIVRIGAWGCSLAMWNDKSIVQIHHPQYKIPGGLEVDFLIISNNAVTNVGELNKQIRARNIILDSSNTRYKISGLAGSDVYSVPHQGAFELKI
jgi:competence protein ComEC